MGTINHIINEIQICGSESEIERRKRRETQQDGSKGAKMESQRREEKTMELEERREWKERGASCFMVTHCVAWRADRDKWPLVQSQQHQCRSRNEMEMEATCCRGDSQFSQDKAAPETRVCLSQRVSAETIMFHRVACWRSSSCMGLMRNKGHRFGQAGGCTHTDLENLEFFFHILNG